MIRGAMLVALVTIASGDTQLPLQAQNALTTIDSVPTQTQLDAAFGGPALGMLSSIAQDPAADVGIKLRAIHALAKYCVPIANKCPDGDPAHQVLRAVIAANADQLDGSAVLVLRAAVESIGPLQVATDADPVPGGILIPLLDHQSRDIRASAAHALRDICDPTAVPALRVRTQHEATNQVKLAISEALRILNQPPCSP